METTNTGLGNFANKDNKFDPKNFNPENMNMSSIMDMFGGNRLPDPTIKSNTLQIECHTAFGPNTPIYVDKRIINMTQMSIGYNKSAKTLGINQVTYEMKECGVLALPEKVYVDYTVDLITEEGIIIECSPGSIVLTPEGYSVVNNLDKGDKIQITKHNIETGEEFVVDSKIDKVDKSRSIMAINTPVYLFVSEYGNIFIPFITEREPNIINLINFKQ